MTVEPAAAFTVTSAGVLALPAKSLTISGALVAASASGLLVAAPGAGVLGFGVSGCGVTAAGVATTASLTCDVLPFLVAVAVTLPAGMSLVGVMLATPLLPAVASPILLLSLSNKATVDPASAFTSTGVLVLALPVRLVVITGLAGATASFSTITFTGTSFVDVSG